MSGMFMVVLGASRAKLEGRRGRLVAAAGFALSQPEDRRCRANHQIHFPDNELNLLR